MSKQIPEAATNDLRHTERLLNLIWEATEKGDLGLASARAALAITHLESFNAWTTIIARRVEG